ncbi:Prolyl 4-hydroxylase subunit alpha-3 [Chionoecetes opilio]|uniref:Prolyl 4-hydroxylase subunit alpha-3 n=1 Tax=Chionoecetes opilio TaxID=41210 RepID=A0A8J5D3K4_CHIOP|nr:Prolyl 4-hydroxylase subunit alpha-3 [Chionoecetes opilio]
MPVRYEQVHTDPELYLFHDVITDAEIHLLKDIASGKLERSTTRSKTENVTENRVSHTAWLANTSHPVLRRLAHRIAEVTQLFAFRGLHRPPSRGATAGIQSYGIGGFYNTHNDVLYKFLPEDKLNDVRAGGRTAFPEAGIALTPQKGAAVLWFNMKRNGNFNPRTLHGGCPVLLGQKWVANRWIRENANFLRRPCSTDPLA